MPKKRSFPQKMKVITSPVSWSDKPWYLAGWGGKHKSAGQRAAQNNLTFVASHEVYGKHGKAGGMPIGAAIVAARLTGQAVDTAVYGKTSEALMDEGRERRHQAALRRASGLVGGGGSFGGRGEIAETGY